MGNVAAILGGGRIARVHVEILRKFHSDVRMKYLIDPFMTEELKDWAMKNGVENTGLDADTVFNDPEVNCVFICSPTPTHSDYIIKACENHKHIYCEKPLDSSIERIKKAIAAVENSDIKMFMGFMRRFDKNQRKLQEVVASGSIGKPHIIKTCSRDPELPTYKYIESSGGIFFDSMIHDFDLTRFFSGSEVEEVYAIGKALVDPKVAELGDVDTAIVNMTFKNGCIGVAEESRRSGCGYDQRTEVHCSDGSVRIENVPETTIVVSDSNGVGRDKPVYFFLERYADAFANAQNAFFKAIDNDEDVPVTIYDGLAAVKVAKAAQKSLDEHRPVKLEEIED